MFPWYMQADRFDGIVVLHSGSGTKSAHGQRSHCYFRNSLGCFLPLTTSWWQSNVSHRIYLYAKDTTHPYNSFMCIKTSLELWFFREVLTDWIGSTRKTWSILLIMNRISKCSSWANMVRGNLQIVTMKYSAPFSVRIVHRWRTKCP